MIIATVSPSQSALTESISTLNYAQSANGIVNKPVASTYHHSSSNKNSSSFVDPTGAVEQWFELECKLKYMEAQIEEAQLALSRKELQQQRIVDRAEKAEQDLYEMETKYEELEQKVSHLKDQLEKENNRGRALASKLHKTEDTLMKTSEVLEITRKTERNLTSEANNLIHAVKRSIDDGNNLYNLLEKVRQQDIERRNATKGFNLAAIEALQDISSKINEITEAEERHRKKISENSTEAHEKDKTSIAQSHEKMNEVAACVQTLTSEIKALALDDKGILPTFTGFTQGMHQNVDGLKELFEGGETKLKTSFEESCDKLNLYSQISESMEENFKDAIKLLRADINEKGKQSKDGMLNMVSAVMNSVLEISKVNTQTRKDLETILSNRQTTSVEVTKDIGRKALKQHSKMEKAMEVFTGKAKDHDEVQKILRDQDSFMNSNGSSQLELVSSQAAMLSSHQQALSDAREKQKRLQTQVVSSVIEGLKNLLTQEVDRLAHETQSQFDAFDSETVKLTELNTSIETISNNIIADVETKNNTMMKYSSELLKNDMDFFEETKQSNNTLVEIKEVTKKHYDFLSETGEQKDEKLKELESLDEPIANAMKQLEEDKTAVVDFHEKVICSYDDGVENVANLASHQSEFFLKEVIPETNDAVNDILVEQQNVYRDVWTDLEKNQAFIDKGHNDVKTIVMNQSSRVAYLQDSVNTRRADFEENMIAARRIEVESRHNEMLEDIENHFEIACGQLTKTTSIVGKIDSDINSFAKNVIHADEEVPEIEPRVKIGFSEVLSSTPSSREIIASLKNNGKIPLTESSTVQLNESNKININHEVRDAKEQTVYRVMEEEVAVRE